MNMYITEFGSKMIRITLHPASHAIIEAFEHGNLVRMKKYEIGDQVEYHKVNISSFGPIVNITEKNIIVKMKQNKVKHLRPEVFGWYNWNFDPSNTAIQNVHEGMYI